jgi:predicted Zn-dependent protease
MKRALVLILAGLSLTLLTHAQFGGIINRAKQKINEAKQKAAPVADRAQRAVDTYSDWTPEQEQQIGEATAAKLVAMFGVVDAPPLTRYVNLVGQAVAQFAPRQLPYRFAILNTDIVGAYSLPGGYIFLTKTSLEAMEDEAQLAGVLGHEILHASDRHLEREIRSRSTSAWAVEEARVKSGGIIDYGKISEDLAKNLFDSSLSRDKEEAADQQGTLLASQAGYSADGLLQFLRALEAARLKNPRFVAQLLSTHPPFADRIAYLTPIVDRAPRGGQTLEERFTAALHQ